MEGHNFTLMKAGYFSFLFLTFPTSRGGERATQMQSSLELQPPEPGHYNVLVYEERHWGPKAKSHW